MGSIAIEDVDFSDDDSLLKSSIQTDSSFDYKEDESNLTSL